MISGRGWPKVFCGADGDDGVLRGGEGKELGRGGGPAAVVADFEQGVGAERGGGVAAERGGDHLVFAGGFGVAFEQGGGLAELEAHDERVVVDGRAGVGVGGRGREDVDVDGVPGEAVAGAEMADFDAERSGLRKQGAVGCGVGIDGDPELARAEVAQDGGHAAHVVGVGVGEGDDVEAAELARPEVGRDDFLADVEGRVGAEAAAFSALAAAPVGPPASMSMARPVGPTTSSESPWPTSMAVTSSGRDGRRAARARGRWRRRAAARRGRRVRMRASGGPPSSRRRCRRGRARACASVGPGTRRSAAWAWLMCWMAAVMACSSSASAAPGSAAR